MGCCCCRSGVSRPPYITTALVNAEAGHSLWWADSRYTNNWGMSTSGGYITINKTSTVLSKVLTLNGGGRDDNETSIGEDLVDYRNRVEARHLETIYQFDGGLYGVLYEGSSGDDRRPGLLVFDESGTESTDVDNIVTEAGNDSSWHVDWLAREPRVVGDKLYFFAYHPTASTTRPWSVNYVDSSGSSATTESDNKRDGAVGQNQSACVAPDGWMFAASVHDTDGRVVSAFDSNLSHQWDEPLEPGGSSRTATQMAADSSSVYVAVRYPSDFRWVSYDRSGNEDIVADAGPGAATSAMDVILTDSYVLCPYQAHAVGAPDNIASDSLHIAVWTKSGTYEGDITIANTYGSESGGYVLVDIGDDQIAVAFSLRLYVYDVATRSSIWQREKQCSVKSIYPVGGGRLLVSMVRREVASGSLNEWGVSA